MRRLSMKIIFNIKPEANKPEWRTKANIQTFRGVSYMHLIKPIKPITLVMTYITLYTS